MDREDIIRMAKQAKLPYEYDTGRVLYLKELERFANLVAAQEREACAQVCETFFNHEAKDCADAIRDRKEK